MKISIIHPSRSRPELATETYYKWMGRAKNSKNIQYILSVDDSDEKHLEKYYENLFGGVSDIVCKDNKSAIEAINNGAKIAKGDLIIVISDDFDCPVGWDQFLLDSLKGKSDFLVKTQDGIQPTLITLPIMDRKYYERFGYVYHPSYIHMSSDVEMTMVGYALDKIITLPLLFKHNHYSVGGIKKDAISIRNDRSYSHGYKNLEARKKINFGLKPEEIIKDFNQIKWK